MPIFHLHIKNFHVRGQQIQYVYILAVYQEVSYSVTQSYANSFWGDVVLDTFNNVSRDEDNILYKIYFQQMCSDFYYEDLKFWKWLKKMHI